MKSNPKAGTEVKPKSRYNELKQMLEERRREIQAEVQGKIRDVRAEASMGGKNEVFDAVESSDAGIQDDIEFALIQMKSETLIKINDALVRLEQQDYGNCFECGEEIAESGCARCRSQYAARTAKRRAKRLKSVSGKSPAAAALRRCSSTCKDPASRGAPPVAESTYLPHQRFPPTIIKIRASEHRRPGLGV